MGFLITNLKHLRKEHGLTQDILSERIGITRNKIASYETGTQPPFDEAKKIVDYFNISIDELMNIDLRLKYKNPHEKKAKEPSLLIKQPQIPLILTAKAAGGFGNGHFAIEEYDVKDYYVIPKFSHKKIDFMIEVEGSSMYPKYNSGDIVACLIIREQSFIQWNKAHVIATKDQGIIIKRIKEGNSDKTFLMVSDNKDYPTFEVQKKDITGLALVVGVIRLE